VDKIYIQSAVIPFRQKDEDLEILLITSLKSGKWIIPKGIIEPGMSAQDSAAIEAWEEAGLKGNVLAQLIGKYEYEKWGGICRVQVYAMRVSEILNAWPERDLRKRQWLPAKKAVKKISDDDLKTIVKQFLKTDLLRSE